jgi:hypothetical protein
MVSSLQLTDEECKQWLKNPTMNPRTGKPIKEYSRLYRDIRRQCDNTVPGTCIELTAYSFDKRYDAFKQKLIDYCIKYNLCNDVEIVRNKLIERHLNGYHNAFLGSEYVLSIKNIKAHQTFEQILFSWRSMKLKDSNNEFYNDYFKAFIDLNGMHNYNITFRDQEGRGIGLVYVLFQGLIDDIKKYKFFIPTEDGSNTYVINPDFDRNQMFQSTEINKISVLTMYEFIGEFLGFCVMNNFGLGFHLSRALVNALMTPSDDSEFRHIKHAEFVMIFLSEFPQEARTVLKFLEKPDMLKDLELSYNDYFQLVPDSKNRPVTPKNLCDYIYRKSKHQLLYQLYTGAKNTAEQLNALRRGFWIQKRDISIAKLTPSILYQMLYGNAISYDTLNQWIPRIQFQPSLNPEVVVWFREILDDKGQTFPWDVVRSEVPNRNEIFLEFIRKLLQFWSGVSQISPNTYYRVNQVSMRPRALPRSHTCFTVLDLPSDIASREDLYRRLVQAVFFVELGVGEYGGGKRRTPTTTMSSQRPLTERKSQTESVMSHLAANGTKRP